MRVQGEKAEVNAAQRGGRAERKQAREIQEYPREKGCEKKNDAARGKIAGKKVGKGKRSKGKRK